MADGGAYLRLKKQPAGFTPPPGYFNLHIAENGHLYSTDDGGVVRDLNGQPGTDADTVVGNGAIPAGALIKASATAGRYGLWLASDNPILIEGAAVTACGGAGQSFTAQFIQGTVVALLSDGTATIPSGSAVVASGTVDGRVKAGFATDLGLVGFNVGALVAATLDAPVSVR